MRYADLILPEFEQEMASTRQLIECIPDDKLEWRAHPKLNTIGWNANHLAEMPGWVRGIFSELSFDLAPVGQERYQSPKLTSRQAILELFDRNVADAKAAIKAVADDEVGKMWSLLDGGQPIVTMPRAAVMRAFVLNHMIHHRAHLSVYLRLNGVAVPGMYGPSGN
jgi:uncharacterized damage-inducible protein DinB